MRIAALYDIHGNLPALEAVLAEVRRAGVDQLLVGGDVLPGPMPRETLDCLKGLDIPARYIRGNGDRVVLAQRAGADISEVPEPFRDLIRWVAEQLTPGDEEWLSGWPATVRAPAGEAGDVVFCHATPGSDVDVFTRETPDARVLRLLATVDVPLVICGHTHMQFDRRVGVTRVVNAGSVGMPFGAPGAYWLLLDSGVQLRRSSYDLAAAAARLATSYPAGKGAGAYSVLQPPSEQAMLQAFKSADAR